jgi:hypothetical protein
MSTRSTLTAPAKSHLDSLEELLPDDRLMLTSEAGSLEADQAKVEGVGQDSVECGGTESLGARYSFELN